MARRVKGEGSIFKDESKDRWVARYYDGIDENGKRIRKTIYAKTRMEVAKKLNEVMYKKNNLLYIEKNGITLIQMIEKNREDKFAANIIGEGQYARLKWTENKIKQSNIANIKIQELTSIDIQNFLNSNTNLSSSYIKKLHELINIAYKNAVKSRIILVNPMDNVIKPRSKIETKEIRSLTIEEQRKLTQYLKSVKIDEEKYKVCFLIELYMGLRIGETLALTVDDIDLKRGYIKVTRTLTRDKDFQIVMNNRAKTFAGRRQLPIPDIIKNEIVEQVKLAENNKDKLLFCCKDEYVRPNSANTVLKRIFETQLGMSSQNISTHALRHTYATRCIESGMNAVVLQKLMGHTDVKITLNTYTSVFNDFKESELNKVSKYLNKNILKCKNEELEL